MRPVFFFGTSVPPGGREGTWEPWGPVLSVKTKIASGVYKGKTGYLLQVPCCGPVLSLGTKIAPGGHEGIWGPVFSIGTSPKYVN